MPVDQAKTQRLLAKANGFHYQGNMPRAERLYRVMLRHDPENAMVNYFYGTLLLQRDELGKARHYLQRAVERAPAMSEALNNLGVVQRKMGRVHEALETFVKARQHGPAAPDVRSNLGSSLMELGRLEDAEKELRKGLEIAPTHQDCNWNLSLALLGQGKWEGFKHYDWGFRSNERQARPYASFIPQWRGQPLAGKSILVWSEQGIGDDILFATCLPDLIATGARIIIDAHPRLEKLFRQSFPGIAVHGNRKNDDTRWLLKIKPDYQAPFGDLPRWFRSSDEDFYRHRGPLLKADPARVAHFRSSQGGGSHPRVGITWRGGAIKTGMNKRSLPLEAFRPILEMDGVRWISLQYGHVFEEVSRFPQIVHDEAAIEDFCEQAALIASCDLIVSVVQTAVHMAGALDVPCLCLVPNGPPWKFIPGEHMPWHSSVRQVWAERDGTWDMDRLRAAIQSSLRSTSPSTGDMRIAS